MMKQFLSTQRNNFFGKKSVQLAYALGFPFLLYIYSCIDKDILMYKKTYGDKSIPWSVHIAYVIFCLFGYFIFPRALLFMPIVAGAAFVYFML
jgi:hypothetical protein